MWRRTNLMRVVVIGVVVAAAAFVLLVFLASLGDTDLPPYEKPFPGERIGCLILEVISWPLVLTAFLIGRDPPFIFWLPLMFLGGLSWATLIEVANIMKQPRRAFTTGRPRG